MKETFKVSLIIPALNEEKSISTLVSRLSKILSAYNDYEIIIIDDGSQDDTLSVLKNIRNNNDKVHYLSLSRNFGHQSAIRAGLDYASGDCVISMDADLQHPPELIPDLVDKWREGFEIVYTIRRQDESLSYFKKKTSSLFYTMINNLTDIKLEQGTADFRLLDKSVVEVLRDMKEYHLFLRGLIVWVGFKQAGIEYTPEKRYAGETKYTMKKMVKLALAGITSFSVRPLYISTILGVICAIIAFLYAFYAVSMKFFTQEAIPGWASVLVSILFIGGLQLIVLGIIGEYIGKLVMEAKNRPHYILREKSLEQKSTCKNGE